MIRGSIRLHTILIALLPMLVAVVLLGIYFLRTRFVAMEAGMIERAELLAKQIGSSGEYALFSGNTEQVQRDVTIALKQRDVAVVLVQDASGKTVAYADKANSNGEQEKIPADSGTGLLLNTGEALWVRQPIRLIALELNDLDPINEKRGSKLLGHVLVKMNKASLQKEKWQALATSGLISLVLIIVTMLIVLRVSRRIVNPIKALNHLAQAIGEGMLDKRVALTPAITELHELAQGINNMAMQLQEERDVLEAKTEALRASEERLNEIINMMPVSLFIKDAQSNLILMNSACEAQWGVLFSSVAGTRAERFFPPEQVSNYLAKDREVFQGRKMVDFEEVIWNSEIRQNRTLHTFKKPVYDLSGAPAYLIGISIDISERKLAETRLGQINEQLETRIEDATRALRLKKEEAEAANLDKTRFLAAASHDLRQPLHALGLFMGELHTQLETFEQRQIMSKVEESVEALSELLDALLDISKLDAGSVKPNISVFPVSDLLDNITRNYTPLAEDKGVSLQVIDHADWVSSDQILLRRILANLVTNAIRYTPPGGRVLLVCRRRANKLRIEVRDNGIGIPPNEQQNIFKEFVQLKNQERDRSKGLGLGLAIVERISNLLKLEVSVRSEVGKGSVFAVQVARVARNMELSDPATLGGARESGPVPGGLEQLKVLVVDDDNLVLRSTQGVIESWGGSVTTASCFGEVKQQQAGDFDLVICDYRLPDGTGLEVFDWIKGNFARQPKFILVSGDTATETFHQVATQGVQLLHKPVRPAKLRSLIQFVLRQR